MPRVLVTGMSGTGKSSLLAELHARGHRTIDTDYGGWVLPDGTWDEQRVADLLDSDRDVVVAGTVENQGRFADRFEHVVLLSAPLDVLLDRLRHRTTNPYGANEAERAEVAGYVETVEPLLRAAATCELDGRRPTVDLADEIERLTGPARHDAAPDPAARYELERRAFIRLLRSLTPDQLALTVPATPAWTVRDVLAHVTGIAADLNAQRFPQGSPDEWTADQVAARRHLPVEEIVAEWDREAPGFIAGLRLFGDDWGAHYLGDLLQHVTDVVAALGRPVEREDQNVAVALSFYLESFAESLDAEGVGAVEVVASGRSIVVGAGAVVATVRGTAFELLRSLGGRRTLAEIAALDWSGDVATVVPIVSRYPAPARSLGESAC